MESTPGARWNGRQWVSTDGHWAWSGSRWLQLRSNLPVVARAAIYAAVGLALNLPIMLVFVLVWGFTGPGWAANPPDVAASLFQIALTLGGALFAFCASWFLLRIDRRDWWLGAAFAWPWIAGAAVMVSGSLVWQPPDFSGLSISAFLVLFAAFPLAGSMVGRQRLWSASARSSQAARPIAASLGRATRATWRFLKAFVMAYLDAASHASR